MPEIIVLDLNHVTIDGVASGSVTDILANRKDVDASEFLAALTAWRDACHCTHDETLQSQIAAHEAAIADLNSKHDADLAARDAALADAVAAEKARGASALADLQSRHDAEIAQCNETAASLSAKITALEADVAERQNMINVLGGTPLGLQMRDEARRQELLAQKERLEAQLASLEAGSANA
jgi:chromosome segregation ATPase